MWVNVFGSFIVTVIVGFIIYGFAVEPIPLYMKVFLGVSFAALWFIAIRGAWFYREKKSDE